MSTRLQFLILWPQREELIKAMPLVFKQNFGNKVAVIIYCFEVFIERPTEKLDCSSNDMVKLQTLQHSYISHWNHPSRSHILYI